MSERLSDRGVEAAMKIAEANGTDPEIVLRSFSKAISGKRLNAIQLFLPRMRYNAELQRVELAKNLPAMRYNTSVGGDG